MAAPQGHLAEHNPSSIPLATSLVAALCPKGLIRLAANADVPAPSVRIDAAAEHIADAAAAVRIAKLAQLTPAVPDADIDKWAAVAQEIAAAQGDSINALLGKINEAVKAGGGYLCGAAVKEYSAADCIVGVAVSAKFDMRAHGKTFGQLAGFLQKLKHHPSLKPIWAQPTPAPASSSSSSAPAAAAATETAAAAPAGKSLAGSRGRMDAVRAGSDQIVTTRFPPEPSGFMHVGHIKAALMNDYFAHIKYPGRLIVRFDDTNPAKEKPEFYESILSDLETVRIKPDTVSYTSDHFDELIEQAERLMKLGKGYVDSSSRDEVKLGRAKGIDSPCRANSLETNLALWDEMKRGTELGMKCVLRGKIDMNHPNRVLRDPSLYRCIAAPAHHRTGTKYKVYPLYDFSIPIVDSLEGVTHALRSSEFHDRNALYDWVVDALGLRKAVIEDFSRLNFAYVLLSKRKLQWFVDHGVVAGWDDPRFPTVRGLNRRGLTIEAMREFVQSQGSSKSINLMDMDKLWVMNKRILDPIVPRYTAIGAEGAYTVRISGAPAEAEMRQVPCHKKNASLGSKAVAFSDTVLLDAEDGRALVAGEEVTLMDWGNVLIETVDAPSRTATARLHLEGSVKDTKKKLTWLSAKGPAPLATVEAVEFDHLITVPKIPEGATWEEYVRPVSRVAYRLLASPDLAALPRGKPIQLERRGYFICDGPGVFNMIPDGSSKALLGQKIVMQWS
jgi:glutamyl-tRNA synthetase